jgi:uncharacterized protein YcgI (DUF1989 family)
VLNPENQHERLWGSKTAWEYGVHLTTGAVLLSTGPWERPLLSIVADTLPREPTAKGTRFHDVMAGCCSTKSHLRRYGADGTLPGCFDVIADALAPYGVPPDFVQDVFKLAMLRKLITEDPGSVPLNWPERSESMTLWLRYHESELARLGID